MEESGFRNPIIEFFDVINALEEIYYENARLKAENKDLKERLDEHHKQIMRMANMSEQGTRNWIDAILEGKIKITEK
jgi:regulator of replication initiation timing